MGGLVPDWGNSIVNATESLKSYTGPLNYHVHRVGVQIGRAWRLIMTKL